MRDYLDIESAPYGEDCVQVNPNIDYMPAMMAETKRFKEMLERRFAKLIEKTGIYFKIARNPHDFGTYLSLQVVFDDENEKQRRKGQKYIHNPHDNTVGPAAEVARNESDKGT